MKIKYFSLNKPSLLQQSVVCKKQAVTLGSAQVLGRRGCPEVLYLMRDCRGAFHSPCSSTTPWLADGEWRENHFWLHRAPWSTGSELGQPNSAAPGIPAPCCRPVIPALVHINIVSWSIQLDFRNCLAHLHHSLHWACTLRFFFFNLLSVLADRYDMNYFIFSTKSYWLSIYKFEFFHFCEHHHLPIFQTILKEQEDAAYYF